MYRTLLRGAVISRKAEFELSGMQALRRKLESSAKANNDFKMQVELFQSQLSEMGETQGIRGKGDIRRGKIEGFRRDGGPFS